MSERGNEFKIIADSSMIPGAVVEKDGIHFGYYAADGERPSLLLYRKGSQEPAAEIPFPQEEAENGFYALKVKISPRRYEYNFKQGERVVIDPYAKKICGRETFGQIPDASPHGIRGGFAEENYDWEGDRCPQLPFEEAVMYHLHVRGFTMQKNSRVRKKGTFAGLQEKIPYLRELGVNQLKLMPVYEFTERELDERVRPGAAATQAEALAAAFVDASTQEAWRLNYWGYGGGFYFAPKASYASGRSAERELKNLVKALHAENMELLLEFAFDDETDIGVIERCLNYWACEYHIDGFSVIARDSVIAEIARLPLFRRRKLISTWYPDYVTAYNKEKVHAHLASSNDGFMNDCRRLLKGDERCLSAFAGRLRAKPEGCAQINYMTNHDGFTMLDLVSYDRKHNEENGEQNRDGSNYNCSWNCGIEGPSKKREVLERRMRQRKNAYAMMLFSQGTPMLLAGDEFGNTQNGNNNPYCHDSELTWTDWSRLRSERELTGFVRSAIAYRKAHPVLHQYRRLQCTDDRAVGFPDLSYHGTQAWHNDFEQMHGHMGCMYAGVYAGEEGLLYIAYNFHWMPQEFALPLPPRGCSWYKVMDTSQKESFLPREAQEPLEAKSFFVPERTIVILEGR